jgi:HTH-type transcriptional regulator / antitoxin HipB
MQTPIRTTGQLAPVLKQLRKSKGWSQAELGQRIGLSQERVSAIENHPEKVNLDTLLTMLMALDAQFTVDLRPATTAPRANESDSEEPW